MVSAILFASVLGSRGNKMTSHFLQSCRNKEGHRWAEVTAIYQLNVHRNKMSQRHRNERPSALYLEQPSVSPYHQWLWSTPWKARHHTEHRAGRNFGPLVTLACSFCDPLSLPLRRSWLGILRLGQIIQPQQPKSRGKIRPFRSVTTTGKAINSHVSFRLLLENVVLCLLVSQDKGACRLQLFGDTASTVVVLVLGSLFWDTEMVFFSHCWLGLETNLKLFSYSIYAIFSFQLAISFIYVSRNSSVFHSMAFWWKL